MSADILRLALEGGRARHAAALVERERPRLEAALRRAVPFVTRRGMPITLAGARLAPFDEAIRDLPRPLHVTPIVSEPGGLRGSLILDAGASGLLLDGVLGGDGSELPELDPEGLTAPQQAVLLRSAEALVKALSDALARLGVRLSRAAKSQDEATGEAPVAAVLELGADPVMGRVVLLVAKESLLAKESAIPNTPGDPRLSVAMGGVELELVVELARVRMALGQVAALRAGDTLPLDLPVDAMVTVRSEGRPLLRGHPTAVGGCIAVKIEPGAGHGD